MEQSRRRVQKATWIGNFFLLSLFKCKPFVSDTYLCSVLTIRYDVTTLRVSLRGHAENYWNYFTIVVFPFLFPFSFPLIPSNANRCRKKNYLLDAPHKGLENLVFPFISLRSNNWCSCSHACSRHVTLLPLTSLCSVDKPNCLLPAYLLTLLFRKHTDETQTRAVWSWIIVLSEMM